MYNTQCVDEAKKPVRHNIWCRGQSPAMSELEDIKKTRISETDESAKVRAPEETRIYNASISSDTDSKRVTSRHTWIGEPGDRSTRIAEALSDDRETKIVSRSPASEEAENVKITFEKIQQMIPQIVGMIKLRIAHFRLPVSFLTVMQVVEQGKCINVKISIHKNKPKTIQTGAIILTDFDLESIDSK